MRHYKEAMKDYNHTTERQQAIRDMEHQATEFRNRMNEVISKLKMEKKNWQKKTKYSNSMYRHLKYETRNSKRKTKNIKIHEKNNCFKIK